MSDVGACPVQVKSPHGLFSPLYFFVGDLRPAAAADGQGSILVKNVKLNVAVLAFAVPRVFTGFSHLFHTALATRVVDLLILKALC